MRKIDNMYSWVQRMRRQARWSAKRAEVLAIRGAELVRGRPSEVDFPKPPPGPKSIEDQEHSAQAESPT
jgi:hypothetical protein